MTRNVILKIAHSTIGVLFTLFALLQYNDPDLWIWIPAYALIAFLAFSTAIGKPRQRLALVVMVVYSIWCVTYLPSVVDWIQMGMPSITGSMKAEALHIELVREFGGLLICLLVVVYYAFFSKR